MKYSENVWAVRQWLYYVMDMNLPVFLGLEEAETQPAENLHLSLFLPPLLELTILKFDSSAQSTCRNFFCVSILVFSCIGESSLGFAFTSKKWLISLLQLLLLASLRSARINRWLVSWSEATIGHLLIMKQSHIDVSCAHLYLPTAEFLLLFAAVGKTWHTHTRLNLCPSETVTSSLTSSF